jgi:hypothetical protein
MIIRFFSFLFLMLVGHAVADYALQSDFMATNKNRNAVPKGYDPARHGPMQTIWPYVLSAHALIHGGMVYLVTGSIALAVAETVSHWVIDFGKCEKWYGIHTDQWAHIYFKVMWAAMHVSHL